MLMNSNSYIVLLLCLVKRLYIILSFVILLLLEMLTSVSE